MSEGKFVDYYKFLMVSPEADRAMIEWAVRLMLTRYGAKNPKTANPEKHELVKTAYRTLVDADRRAEYDQERQGYLADNADTEPESADAPEASRADAPGGERRGAGKNRLPIDKIRVEMAATIEDVRLQQRMRQAVVSALYDIMVTRPRNPELGRGEIAKLVGCRTDDLESAIWYVREKDLLRTSNSGLYGITAEGIEWVEAGGVPHLSIEPGPQMIQPRPAKSETAPAPRPAVAGG